MASLYRIALPFLGILVVCLIMIMYIPKLSTLAIEGDIAKAKTKAAQFHEPPREAWLIECVQEDRNNPLPCTEEDKRKWGASKDIAAPGGDQPEAPAGEEGPKSGEKTEDELLDEMMGDDKKPESEDELLKEMLGEDAGTEEGAKGKAGDEPKTDGKTQEDKLLDEMMK